MALIFPAGIFDPDTRLAALTEVALAVGFPEEAVEAEGFFDDTIAALEALTTSAPPDTTSDLLENLTNYVTALSIINIGTNARFAGITGLAAIPDVATANASDLATAIALVNALKASHNTLLGELRGAGILDT